MASSGPPADDEHGNVPLNLFRTALADIQTIIGADARTFSKKRAETVGQHLATMEIQFLKLLHSLDELKTIVKSQSSTARSTCTHTTRSADVNSKQTYSAVAAFSPPKPSFDPLCTVKVFPKPSPDASVSPITSAETTKQMVQSLDLKGKKIGIKNIKSINRNGVSILCRNQSEAKTLAETIRAKVNTTLEVKTPQKRNPTMSMLLRGKDYNLDDLKKDILLKNNIPDDADSINLVHKRETDNGNTVVVMIVSPATHKVLAADDFKLYVGWTRVKLREKDPISQCWLCHRFGHDQYGCQFKINGKKAAICSRCGKSHKNDEEKCKDELCCPLCTHHNTFAKDRGWKELDTKHGARFAVCPIRIKAFARAKALINYG